jgi:glycosyltransferase involved in cell wall biosynthesis
MTNNQKRFLLIHQGSELYGSDRSFLTTTEILREAYPEAYIEVHLPTKGSLGPLIAKSADKIIVDEKGYLRKADFRKHGLQAVFNILSKVTYYFKHSKSFDLVYINTIVCISAIIGTGLLRRHNSIVHVREIPTGIFGVFFKALLLVSASRLIFNSAATKKAFSLHGEVVFNGVEPVYEDVVYPNLEGGDSINFLIIGRINGWKGQKFFVESLSGTTKKINVRIVGDVFDGCEHFKDDLVQAVEQSNLNVQFFCFENDPSTHFEWCHYVVVPSTLPEPFGRVAIESMSVKRPVIAANHGGLLEIISDDENGLLFEANDSQSLRKTVENATGFTEEKYHSLCTKAYEIYLEKFSIHSYKKGFLNAFQLKQK